MANDPLGVDLAFTDDLQVSATGDFDTLGGTENVRQAILRRLLTVPGTLVHRPDYGCGVLALQGAPMTLSVKQQLAAKIAGQLTRDPRVVSVESVGVSADDSTPSTVYITVKCTIRGIGSQTFKYTPFSEVVV